MSLHKEKVDDGPDSKMSCTSPGSSCGHVKSAQPTMKHPLKLINAVGSDSSSRKRQRLESSEPSGVSVKSNSSMLETPEFSDGPVTPDPVGKIHRLIRSVPSSTFLCQSFIRQDNKETALQTHKQETGVLQRVKDEHKASMKNKYERLFEGIKLQVNETLLNRIYTQLYIMKEESEGVNKEHEVLQMEKTVKTQHSQYTPIYCNDIFKVSPETGCEEKDQIKIVLTKGIAGIGKTISVQKFVLDWAEGKANHDVDFMFVLSFRELNLIQNHQHSLHSLVLDFHPELQHLNSKIYEECKVVFIFDGLDENKVTLLFSDSQKVCDVTETSSVAVLVSNLMKGELLPSALIWITSRPAAANQIPTKYIDRVTEIQGFNETQKEEYFRLRIRDEHQASKIVLHIKKARSLHIMCHIPIFCWISSTVLQKLLEEDLSVEIPQTLTEMYIHFLLIQINIRNEKYEERDPAILLQSNREVIVNLAGVAFKQLIKGNVMFYEEDLIESGIDVTDASVYSGICTEIFKEESVIHQRKVYSFIHLSVQEFLAAFYVFSCYLMKKKEPLQLLGAKDKHDHEYDTDPDVDGISLTHKYYSNTEYLSDEDSFYALLTPAVDKALKSKNGHLDLFLRFLMGVSLESNQRLLKDLLTHTENSSESIRRTTQYIKEKIKNGHGLSIERSINLFLCLLEVKDQTLSREIQAFVKSDKHSEKYLSPAHCSAIAYMLQISEEVLDELDLKKYNTSDEGKRRLIPAVNNCRKALLAGCNLTGQHCKIVSSALQSSVLRELDLSNNDLQDSVNLLSHGLKSANCQLELLRLRFCNLTSQHCEIVSSALQSSNSVLRELDLSNNNLQDSGMEIFSSGLQSSNCRLKILRLPCCNLTGQSCEIVSSALQSSNYVLRELNLSNNDLQDSGVKLLSDGLKCPNCQLEILRLSGCMVTEEGCVYLSSALSSNPSHLRELDLSYNHPGQSGVQLLNQKMEDPNCSLQILNVDHGGEFMMTAGLRKYACDLSLDPNTANTQLILSEDNRKVTRVKNHQPYPDHPERFEQVPHVLCRESLTGRCYWEAEWSGYNTEISVTYKGISRKAGGDCWFGYNEKSWSLICTDDGITVWHNNKFTDISTPSPFFNTVGVYVDVLDGTLSFYSVSDTHTLTHLHTFNTTFTEPLYAGFKVSPDSSVSLC
ncbi:NACHT, LRR and PYD domains-containing protein 12-like isoform X2 [Carassius auratus]|uniref:NACHT, LRR and PYD domains-containing protein 12-like isoform X2 n=2 Tax=Carassius auratus TaxID=7957 RepID=A0A6P6QZK0_CARAU|nr:NACHT, LRR and PYD domains-containing protein 12-like isoform X2 [Carassius auratus]